MTRRGKPGGKNRNPSRPKRARDPNRPTRTERMDAARHAKQRRSMWTRVAILGLAAVLLLGVAGWKVAGRRSAQRTIASFTSASCRYDTRSDSGRVNEHSPNPIFNVNPPSGGVHLPSAAPGGTYTVESAPPEGQVVHALEHGLIAIHYRPDLPQDSVAALREIASDNAADVLLLPRPGLNESVAATAWHRRLLCSDFNAANIGKFVNAYQGKGPEKVPRN